jgi:hypothetical protein
LKRFVKQPDKTSDEPEKSRTPEELEEALEVDIGYVILQTFPAFKLFHEVVVPVLHRIGLHKEIDILNNASLESQLLSLRKLNEFFMRLPENEQDEKKRKKRLKPDDLRAEHYTGFTSPGAFLSEPDEAELHKRVGHITLIEVRNKKKDWGPLITGYMPIAVIRMLEFCCFLRDSYLPLSSSARQTVKFYIETLEGFAKIWPMTAAPNADS